MSKKVLSKDKALSRRFQTIDIKGTTVEETIEILKGIKENYENYHQVEYTEAAIKSAVILSDKYINERYLPDKAIDVMDEAVYASIKMRKLQATITINEKVIEEVVAQMCKIPKNCRK